MQIPYKNLDKALLFSRIQVFCLKNWKPWRAPTTIVFDIFFLKLSTRFLITSVYETVFGIFFILFRSWVICKNQKDLVSTYLFFTIWLITRDLNKIKKNPEHSFVDIVKLCKMSAKNIKLYGSWNSSKF